MEGVGKERANQHRGNSNNALQYHFNYLTIICIGY